MKSILKESPRKPVVINYPCVMIEKENRMVVLMSAKDTGTVLNKGYSDHYATGEHSDRFIMEYFELLDGTITISN